MSNITNSGLDQYGAEPFEQQQFATAGVEGVKPEHNNNYNPKPAGNLASCCGESSEVTVHGLISGPWLLYVPLLGTIRPLL